MSQCVRERERKREGGRERSRRRILGKQVKSAVIWCVARVCVRACAARVCVRARAREYIHLRVLICQDMVIGTYIAECE